MAYLVTMFSQYYAVFIGAQLMRRYVESRYRKNIYYYVYCGVAISVSIASLDPICTYPS